MPLRCLTLAAFLAALTPVSGAQAWTLKTLYSFCSQTSCTDGSTPLAGLLRDSSGNLYGTAQVGGAHGNGVVFELSARRDRWTYKVLHDFCYQCGDGTNPNAGLVIDVNGNLYGTTGQSGPTGCGTAFRLSPNTDRSKWKETTIYAASCAPFGNDIVTGLTYDGAATGAPYDGASPLYGTTNSGGTGSGTVYEIVPKGTKWKETDLYAFCPDGSSGCTDGRSPGTVVTDANGYLYGNTNIGGSNGAGIVYELKPNTKKTEWTEHVLYSFCSAANCTDGGYPDGALALDKAGNLFGTTTVGASESGNAFELQKRKDWRETVLYTFCAEQNCQDGYLPQAGLLIDASGSLYGTTSLGGTGGGGTIFQLQGRRLSTLYDFCSVENCADGGAPLAPLTMDSAGNIYGTASGGGGSDGGTVFELTP